MKLETENYIFTPSEQDRIARFIHVAHTAAQEKQLIKEGQDAMAESSWTDEKGNKHSQKTFKINERLIGVMEDIAFNMYYGNPKQGVLGLKDHENTKWAADHALEMIRESFPSKGDIFVAECEDIWSRS